MSRIIEGMIPPGGWHYKDANGYRIPHTSELPGPNEVIDAILEYRLENGIPTGSPQQDFENYICQNFQRWCSDAPAPNYDGPSAPPPNKFVDKIAQWANTLYDIAGKLLMVPLREAEQRATLCMQCPRQQEWEGDCPRCVENAHRITKIIRQGRDVPQWRKLKGCSAQGFCSRTAVHLDKAHLAPATNEAWEKCWLR